MKQITEKTLLWECVPFMRGRGLQITDSGSKMFEHVVSVGPTTSNADFKVDNLEDLNIFSKESLDFIYSEVTSDGDGYKNLFKLLKQDGFLILVFGGTEEYPNPLSKIDGWDLVMFGGTDWVESEVPHRARIYVFKKIKFGKLESYKKPKPKKTAVVWRCGAFGDLMQASSVLAGLKQQGFHVTLIASTPGMECIMNDPNIDEIVQYQVNHVPNAQLVNYWDFLSTTCDRFVNLSESVEATFLTDSMRTPFRWNPSTREMYMSHNYLEFQHKLAGVPHVPQIKFYATEKEKLWALEQKRLIGGKVIVWSLKGSSPHKWYNVDLVMDKILAISPDIKVLLMGGPECLSMEEKYDLNPRVIRTVGKWPIRFSLAFAQVADLVIGPETGVLNAVSCESMPKITFLSHSTIENFSRDWVNTTSIYSKNTSCPGRGNNEALACHMLHQTFDTCKQDEVTKMSQCMADIDPDEIVDAIKKALNK